MNHIEIEIFEGPNGLRLANGVPAARFADKRAKTPPVPSWETVGVDWAFWGFDDLLPTQMRRKVEQVPIAGAVIKKKIDMLLGNGLVYYKTADLANGPNVDRAYLPEVEDFLEGNRIETEWLPAQVADFCLPFNAFSEVVLSADRTRATNLYHISAEHARLSAANERSGRPEFLLYSYHFPYRTGTARDHQIALPLMRWDDEVNFLNYLRQPSFGWHTRFPTSGQIYYARPFWIGLFKDGGWLDVSAEVPKIIRAMQQNQISLKYIIRIPISYFTYRYPDWASMSPVDQSKLIDAKIDELNKALTGTEATMKSISNVFHEDEITGNPRGQIQIEAVDNKTRTDMWVPDSFAADAQVVQGFGLMPSQIGLAPEGGKMGAGSGSDVREGYNLAITLNTADQKLILGPLNWISRYNGWGVRFAIDHTAHTTSNLVESGLVPSRTSTQIVPQNG